MSQFVTTPDGKRHVFPDAASPEQIKAALASYASPQMAMTATNNPTASRVSGIAGRALRLLPDAGGFAGGIVGGGVGAMAGGVGAVPGAIAGAAIGGATGEAARQAVSGESISGRDIAVQGASQGAYEAVGGAIAKGAEMAARPLMGKALGVVSSLAKRFRTTPEEIAKIVLDNRFPVSVAGEAKATIASGAIRRVRNARIAASGGTIGAPALSRVVIADSEKALGRRMTRAERATLVSKVQDEANAILTARTHGAVPKATPGTPAQPASTVLNQFGQPAVPAQPAIPAPPSRYTARETEQVKEVAAKNARPEYRATQSATSVAADPALSKQVAAGTRAKVNAIPGVKSDNVKIQKLMVAQQAIGDAVAKGSEEWTPLHVGPLALGVKVPRNHLATIAHLFNSSSFQKVMRQSPRTAVALIRQLFYTDSEPDTSKASAVAKIRGGP